MAITCNWSVNNMTHNNVDGGVIIVHWSCAAKCDTEGFFAVENGKLKCTPDPASSTYIPYADLTEANVLGWVYSSLIEGDETADEAKERIEANRTARVQGQIDRANTQSSGIPWS
jgi:hypothetical protein